MITLPDHRVLYASRLDPETDPAPFFEGNDRMNTRFVDAIHGGKQLHLETNGDELNIVEACLTEFTDPVIDNAIRYAVEMWNDPDGFDTAKHDFASYDEAYKRYVHYVNELKLGEPLS